MSSNLSSMNQDTIQLEEGWNALKSGGIDKLEYFLDTGDAPPGSPAVEPGKPVKIFGASDYSRLYTMVYNMCTQKHPHNWSEKLYIRHGETLAQYVQQKVLPALSNKRGIDLLVELKKRWQNHKLYVKWMDRFFQYLDRYYVKIRSAEPMNSKGLSIFRNLVFDQISPNITSALLAEITSEREGFDIQEDIIRTVVEMYIELGVKNLLIYQREFEESLLPATALYYAKQAKEWLESDIDFPTYLKRAEKALEDEESRVNRYLHPSTCQKLRAVVIMQLLHEPQKTLLSKDTAIDYLLRENRLDDLARAFRMFALVDGGLVPIATTFRQFVTQKGSVLVDSREQQQSTTVVSDPTFVQSLIDLHDQYKSIVSRCFQSDTSFQKSLKEAFEVFINREFEKTSIAALMASFCDRILRKSGERMTDETMEDSLAKLVDLFSFLADKDDFAEIYRNQLSKRLLTDSSASEDAEKNVIQRLKMKCGATFTSKLEGMITDLALANDMQREFRDSVSMLPGLEFSVTVLTTGFWPTYTPIDTVLTPLMVQNIEVFKDFYSKRTQHRRLQWIHSLGTVTVAAKFDNGSRKFDLVMNTYQALILSLFNDKPQWSVGEISATLKLEEQFVRKLLATFVLSKFKVLAKVGDDETVKTIEPGDVFTVNESFTVAHRRIKIPPPVAGSGNVDETHNKSKIEEDRSFSIEAAIVRVMKTRKVLQHQQLVAEVIAQLTLFKPNPKLIKQKIENLIEREFLERDADNQNMYKYLA